MDPVDQHRFIPRLGVDGAGTELIPGQLEERPPHAVLRDAESRLDEEAEWHRRVGFDPHVDTALTFDHSSEKPAALLLARQAFLLIACTGRIVTHSPSLPRGQDGKWVPPDTQVSQHIARFCNRPYVDGYSYRRRLPGLSFRASPSEDG